ncbi:hypothetical protein BDV95DRAFT_491528 [Massariosphaeria phaeospora]|uniref:DUF1279 domain-containing protein n=1 Tax=Massariosphaeria phaeospora TaxID=100035 RepID=A0A7C8MDA5_9PLEO|nr:hypothetical protein BDV95DRAFT_491528 [Massariosphaeria phaeospora]
MNSRIARFGSEQLLFRGTLSRSSAYRQSAPALRNFFAASQTAGVRTALQRCAHAGLRAERSLLFRRFRSLRFKSDKTPSNKQPNPTPNLGSPEPAPSLSQRLKKLSREYGWTALGVYMALTALDFPFCFLAVRMLGTDRIGHYEHVIVEGFWNLVRLVAPNAGPKPEVAPIADDIAADTAREGGAGWSGEVELADAKNSGAEASIWTQLALAYAVHKVFIFVRVPLTAALLPKVVKTLRGWGYDIGKRKPKTN